MHLTLSSAPTLYSTERAAAIAKALQDSDPEWTYTPIYYGNGYASVQLTDEDGEFIGYWKEQ